MAELLLQDEPNAIEWEETIWSPKQPHTDTSWAAWQYYLYSYCIARHRASVYSSGREWEDSPHYVLASDSITEDQLRLVWSRDWQCRVQTVDALGTVRERVGWALHEGRHAEPIETMITAVLSQTGEYLGWALQRQLKLTIEPSAFKLLGNSTLAGLAHKALARVAMKKRAGMPIGSVSLTSFRDPEAANAEELVIRVSLDCDPERALQVWDDLSASIEDLKERLSQHEIKLLDERLGLDCEW